MCQVNQQFWQKTSIIDLMPASIRKIFFPLAAFIIGLVIGWVGISFLEDKFAIIGGPYRLPGKLTYSEQSDWKNVSGEGWRISVKEDWGLKSNLGIPGILSNGLEDEKSFSILVLPMPGGQSIKKYMEDVEDNFDKTQKELASLPSAGETKLLKSQTITINNHEAGMVFLSMELKEEDFNAVMISVLIDKNGQIYNFLIVTTDEFYKPNRSDFRTLISSFR
jgi:hypothetical protein